MKDDESSTAIRALPCSHGKCLCKSNNPKCTQNMGSEDSRPCLSSWMGKKKKKPTYLTCMGRGTGHECPHSAAINRGSSLASVHQEGNYLKSSADGDRWVGLGWRERIFPLRQLNSTTCWRKPNLLCRSRVGLQRDASERR